MNGPNDDFELDEGLATGNVDPDDEGPESDEWEESPDDGDDSALDAFGDTDDEGDGDGLRKAGRRTSTRGRRDESKGQGGKKPDPETADPDGEEDPETTDEGGDAGDTADIELTESDLDAVFKLPSGERKVLRDLLNAERNQFPREAWLRKTQELATERKAVEQARQAVEAERAKLGGFAEHLEVPHVFLDQYLRTAIDAGLLPQSVHDALNAEFAQMIQDGVYNPNAVVARSQMQRELRVLSEQKQQVAYQSAHAAALSEIASIEASRKAKLDASEREAIAAHISEMEQIRGERLSIRQAYDALVKAGKIKPKRTAQASPRKFAERIRNRATITAPTSNTPTRGLSLEEEGAAVFRALKKGR